MATSGAKLAFIATVIIVVSAIAYLGSLSANLTGISNQSCGSVSTTTNPMPPPPAHHEQNPPTPLVLHSVQYAENVVKEQLVQPNPSLIGDCYKVSGVEILEPPTNYSWTLANGSNVEYTVWDVYFVIWDRPVVNGTTTMSDVLSTGGLTVEEFPTPPGPQNSTASTIDVVVTCGTTCTTETTTRGESILKMNGLSIINWGDKTLSWVDDRRDLQMNVVGYGVSDSQLLALAEYLTMPALGQSTTSTSTSSSPNEASSLISS